MPSNKSSIDQALIRQLAELLTETDLSEIEVEHDSLRIRVARTVSVAAPTTLAVASAPVAAAPVAQIKDDVPPIVPVASAQQELANHPGVVRSPMVGTAYLAAEPGSPDFVKIGDSVSEGQTILIIEAMKTMNNIPAHKSGKVVQINVENEQPVEFGEPLIVIE